MAIKIIMTRGLKDNEYEAIKAAAKVELGFKVNIRRHTNTVRSYHSIDIRPTSKDTHGSFKNMWSDEQTMAVYEFCQRHNLDIPMASYIPMENVAYCYRRGFGYLSLIVSQ